MTISLIDAPSDSLGACVSWRQFLYPEQSCCSVFNAQKFQIFVGSFQVYKNKILSPIKSIRTRHIINLYEMYKHFLEYFPKWETLGEPCKYYQRIYNEQQRHVEPLNTTKSTVQYKVLLLFGVKIVKMTIILNYFVSCCQN